MLGTLFVLIGLAELLFPKRVVDAATRLAYETPDDVEVRPWLYTAARVEGAVFLLLALRRFGRCSDGDGDVAETD
jgi:hypothetical protein